MYLLKDKLPTSCYQTRLYLGNSQTGKTSEMMKYLINFDKFYPEIDVRKVIVIAPMMHQIYSNLESKYGSDKFHFFNELNSEIVQLFDENLIPNKNICLVVVDDLACDLAKSTLMEKIVTTMVSHKYLCLCLTFQGLFQFNTPQFKTICRNASTVVITNSPRERRSIEILFGQLFGKSAYKKADYVLKQCAMENLKRYNSPYYFLYLNLSPDIDEKLRIVYDYLSDYPIIFT